MFEENKMSALHFGNLSEDTTSQLDKKKYVEPSDWTKNLEKYIPGAHYNPQTNSEMSNDLPDDTPSLRTVFFGSKKIQDISL